jgi:nicotinamide-nucleotide amidase
MPSMNTFEITAHLLKSRGKTLAVAESCTGGLLAKSLTDFSGSSAFFKLGVVAYSNAAKIKIVRVPAPLIKDLGAVSEEVAVALAKGIRKIAAADFGVGITGIAGPTGGTKTKPVGLVYIAAASPDQVACIECRLKGTRASIRQQAARRAAGLLSELL